MHPTLLYQGLFQIQSGIQRLGSIAQAPDEITDRDTFPVPLLAQHISENVLVLAGPLPVNRVVGGHNCGHALVHAALEVRQVHIVQIRFIDGHIHLEASIFHRV